MHCRGPQLVEPAREVLGPGRSERAAGKHLDIQTLRCVLRGVLPYRQSTGHRFGALEVAETALVLENRARGVLRRTTGGRGEDHVGVVLGVLTRTRISMQGIFPKISEADGSFLLSGLSAVLTLSWDEARACVRHFVKVSKHLFRKRSKSVEKCSPLRKACPQAYAPCQTKRARSRDALSVEAKIEDVSARPDRREAA